MIDAAFVVHPGMKCHMDRTFSLAKGAIQANSIKLKVNLCTATEAELNGVDDETAKVLWTKNLLKVKDLT